MASLPFLQNILLSNFKILSFSYKLTFAVTYKCNSRCKFCLIWKKKPEDELTLGETEKFFKINNFFNWIDLTGGEPFLRDDLVKICSAVISDCPNLYLLHIPTNGILTEKIVGETKKIIKLKPHRFIISIAMDGPAKIHDKLRGIKGNWQKAVETFEVLKKIQSKRFEVYFGMTLSGENYHLIEKTYQSLRKETSNLKRSDLHFNIAHHSSFYYDNLEVDLGLTTEISRELTEFLRKKEKKFSGVQFLESRYQKLIPKYLKTYRSPLSCQALSSSVFIDPKGDIYPCAMWDKKIGNLKDFDFDLKKFWQAAKIKNIRERIKNKDCPGCWTPCEAYQTILGNLIKI